MSKRIKTTMAIALIALATSAGTQSTQAQEQENYAWITNTNGMTWKGILSGTSSTLAFSDSTKPTIAQIIVPEHARIRELDVRGCANLTNLIIQPTTGKAWTTPHNNTSRKEWVDTDLTIHASGSGLRNITAPEEMMHKILIAGGVSLSGYNNNIHHFYAWLLRIQWTVAEPPKMEVRRHSAENGIELEIIWRTGNLQIADAVSGEWRDHIGRSPLRFPLASAKDKQFFRIKPEEGEEQEENQGIPPQPEK